MAIFRAITFFIHAIVAAMAGMLTAVFTHIVPAVVGGLLVLAGVFALCTTCGVGGLAVWRRKE